MEWTIQMSEKELERKEELDKVEGGWITQKEAAEKLGISERQFRRILRRYRKERAAGIVSLRRGRPSNRRLPEEVDEKIRRWIRQPRFAGFGPTLMQEKLEEMAGIGVSKETVRKRMLSEGIYQAKVKKPKAVHPPRERRQRRGELVQMDGSYHAWLEERGPKACLLLFVDDATSQILAGKFAETESYFNYGALCKQYFHEVGIPVAFYSDRFTVFKVNRGGALGKESITQFQRALEEFGIDLICANSPQAKGRVERANETCQDRLIKELRLREINTYAEANAYLPEFIQDYNRKFAVEPLSSQDDHLPLDPNLDLDFIFSIHDYRTITKDMLIHYDCKTYQVITKRHPMYLAKQQVLITMDELGKVSAWLNGIPLELKELKKYKKSAQVMARKEAAYVPVPPAVDHPWRTYGKKLNGQPVVSNH